MSLISEIIAANSSIRSLNLELNLIDDGGAKALCQSLLNNKTLENLDLGWNRIGEEGARNLHNHLSSFMKRVVFHGNGLSQVNDLCQVAANYFEDKSPAAPKLKRVPSARMDFQKVRRGW
jgi:Ran GTPase-activating protein (RanGAP) involved in mRNA processing and transport